MARETVIRSYEDAVRVTFIMARASQTGLMSEKDAYSVRQTVLCTKEDTIWVIIQTDSGKKDIIRARVTVLCSKKDNIRATLTVLGGKEDAVRVIIIMLRVRQGDYLFHPRISVRNSRRNS